MDSHKICLNIESPKKLKELKQFLELNNQPIKVWCFKYHQFNNEYNFLQYFNGAWYLWSQGKRIVLTLEEFKERIEHIKTKSK